MENLKSRIRHSETIVLVHRRERPHKCSVMPLQGRDGFIFHTYPDPPCPDPHDTSLANYVRLGFGGPVLGPGDGDSGLLILDATWKLARHMENVYRDVPIRSLPRCETAYPRVSRKGDDPQGGLATIEAIFIAHTVLGRDTTGLLDHYHWSEQFLQRNKNLILQFKNSREHRERKIAEVYPPNAK